MVETAGGPHTGGGKSEEVDGERQHGEERKKGQKKKGAQPGNQQAGRREVAGLKGIGVEARHVGLTPTVPPILPKEVGYRLPALPGDRQVGIEEQRAALLPDAIVELEVFVRQQPLIPTAELPDERGGISAEGNVVDRSDRAAVVIGGIADAERRSHGGGGGAAGGRRALPIFPAADPAEVAGLEVMDQATDVVGW